MATYYTNEGAFDLPDGFADKSVHTFSRPLDGGGEIGVVVARARLPKGNTLEQMVVGHVEQEAKTLRAFSVVERRPGEVAGVIAIDVSSRFRDGAAMAYQRQLHFVAYGQWMLIGVTSPLVARGDCDEMLAHVVSTFRLREM